MRIAIENLPDGSCRVTLKREGVDYEALFKGPNAETRAVSYVKVLGEDSPAGNLLAGDY